MKTTHLLQRLCPGLACLLFAFAAVSCQSTGVAPKATAQMSMMRKSWVKVSSQPPTYYPRGVAADSPTDHWSGEWVYTGDERGTRYFIPLRGLECNSRQNMIADALGKVSDQKRKQIAAEDQERLNTDIGNAMICTPLLTAGYCLAIIGQSDPGVINEMVREYFDSSK